jgi:hypothetical protein
MGRGFIPRKIYGDLAGAARAKNAGHQAPLCVQIVFEYQAELMDAPQEGKFHG